MPIYRIAFNGIRTDRFIVLPPVDITHLGPGSYAIDEVSMFTMITDQNH